MILASYLELATNAHKGISFSPEKRGESTIKEFSEELESDLARVREMGGDATEYQNRYTRAFSAWLSAKSRCLSTMITGGSNFPVRRAEKANRSEQNRFDEFQQLRKKYFARLARNQRREERAASDPLVDMKKKLAYAQELQQKMKDTNALIRKHKTYEARHAALLAYGWSKKMADYLLEVGHLGGIGFASYQLTNNNANIKRMEGRVKELAAKQTRETKEVERADGIKVVQNIEADRLQIFFPDRPASDMIATLKRNGFKWAPSNGCWQRQLTNNALYSLRFVLPAPATT